MYEFYIIGFKNKEIFSMTVRGVSIYLVAEDIVWIFDVLLGGWDHYAKFEWALLDNLASALGISMKFSGDPLFVHHRRVLKSEMSPIHKLYFDVVHKILIPQNKHRTKSNFLDLILMELFDTKVKIDLPTLVIKHMHCV